MNGEMPALPNQQPEQPEKKGLLKVLALLKVGIIEVLLVSVVLVLLFEVLNYFNILSLSKLYPNQLGWLPHQITPETHKPNYSPKLNIPNISSPIPDAAKQALNNFIPTILTPALIPKPSQITIEQGKNLDKGFISSWHIEESAVTAIVVTTDTNSIAQLHLLLEMPQDTPPSVDIASTITSKLFYIKPKREWGCKPLYNNTMTYCENFWEEKNGTRRGLGMKGLFTQQPNLIKGQSKAMIVFCEHSKESKIYSWKSCEFEFAETGVK